jgi:UDP-N-acetylglucosamine acyltransferase
MSRIHPLAHVDPEARLGADVEIGPYCFVGPGVELGDGCQLYPHVTLLGPLTAGRRNRFFPQSVIGSPPQDLKYKGGPTQVIIGDDNVFREHVTIHRGTEVDRRSEGVTRIGNHNLLMVGVHVAHDAELRNNVILANQVQLAGHVLIEDCVNVGGASCMHHFVTIGRNAFVGGMTRVTHDVPPYMKAQGDNAAIRAVNSEGLKRWKFSPESIAALKQAFRQLYARRGEHSPGRTLDALREIESDGLLTDEHVRYLVEFLRRKLQIGIFGRVREHGRTDGPRDREGFYAAGRGCNTVESADDGPLNPEEDE